MTPEGRVKAKVKKALEQFGRDCWRFMPVQTGYGAPALDFLLSIRGRFVAIETKAPGKKLTPQQEQTKAAIERAGGIVLVVWDESSLGIAMKILLALEFAPRVDIKPYEIPQAAQCLDAVLGTGPERSCDAVRTTHDAAWPDIDEEAVEPAQAPDKAAGRDHGASGAPPRRRAQSKAGGHDQRASAEDVKYCTCGASQAFPARAHRHGCPRYGLNDGNC